MFPKALRIAPLLRSLLLGAACATATVGASSVLVGCADENDPKTWVERLDDPQKQPSAIKRLIQFYEDAMTRDKKDREGPTVKPLLDTIVEPLTKVCTDGNLQERTRSTLVKFLADSHDKRAEPCFKKTLADYKPDTNEEDVRWVMRAAGKMKLTSLTPEAFKVFTTIQVSKPKASLIYRDVNDAILELVGPAQEAELIALVERPMPTEQSELNAIKNEAFWQIVAAKALGNIKSEKAVGPLLKVVLSPGKAPVRNTALVSLVKIGKPAIGPAEDVLKGTNKELVDFAKTEALKGAEKDKDGKPTKAGIEAAEKAYISTTAEILGALGREDAVGPLLGALESADDVGKAIIALQLPQLPRSAQTTEAFKKVFESSKPDMMLPGIGNKRELMMELSSGFFDASMVPWIVKMANDAKGEQQDVDALRTVALSSAMKLMKADQLAEVDALYATKSTGADGKPSELGKAFEKEYKQAKELVTNCKDQVDCYIAKLTDQASQEKAGQFTGIKAAYMLAAFGDDSTKQKILDSIPKIENDAVRFTALKALEALSPKGDAAAAAKLLEMQAKAEEAKDDRLIKAYEIMPQIAARLATRAQ